jgi:hypothetical protein
MASETPEAGTSVVTSLPDASELPKLSFDAWRAWFVDAARTVIRWVPEDSVAIFYQSDVRRGGVWVDKGYLVMRVVEEEGASIAWHKIVCRAPPGTVAPGRPSYSHMICVSRRPREFPKRPGPDVLPDAGASSWTRAMGVEACRVACAYLRDETETRVVVDPFCGRGTLLAVAEAMGLASVGVEISARRCRAARSLVIDDLAISDLGVDPVPMRPVPR